MNQCGYRGGLDCLDGEAGEAGGVVVLLVAHQVRRRHVPVLERELAVYDV
jgi:hypothetical protein